MAPEPPAYGTVITTGGGSVKNETYDEALAAYLANRLTEAAAGFEAVLALDPENEDALEMAANARRALGDESRAVAHERSLTETRAKRHAREAAGDLAAEPREATPATGDSAAVAGFALRATFVIVSALLILLAGAAVAVAEEASAYFLGALVAALVVAGVGGADLSRARTGGGEQGLAWELAGFAAALSALGLLALAWFQGLDTVPLAIALAVAAVILGGYVTLRAAARRETG